MRAGKLEAGLLELVKIRASQINGCAFCLEMHNREAREHGEAQRRLDVLAGWREVPGLFTERERAALALTEVVTMIADAGVPDEIWDEAARHYDEKALAALLVSIGVINVWNRFNAATRQIAGNWKP